MRTTTTYLALVCATVLAACSRKSESSAPSDAAASSPPGAASITVSAADLVGDYADAARADAKYKSKRLRVSGVVIEGSTDGDHPGALLLAGAPDGDASAAAQCTFVDALATNVAKLAKGTRLTIECDCAGKTKRVMLERCSFGGASATAPSASGNDGNGARDVCAKLEAAGVAAKCRAEGAGDKARFDLPSVPGKSGLVVRFADDATFAKYEAGVAAQPATSPLRPYVASARARVVVHLADGVPADVEQKAKAAVAAL